MDALDRRAWKPFNREQKMAFAKQKSEEELSSTLGDRRKVKAMSSRFESIVEKQKQEAFKLLKDRERN